MGNNHVLKITGIGTIKIKMFDGTIRTIGEVRYVNGLKKIYYLWDKWIVMGTKLMWRMKL